MDESRMLLSMRTKLILLARLFFSETARSRPGHHEARRDQLRVAVGVLAVGLRRASDDLAEHARERAQADEADVEADLRDAAVGLPEQEHRALDAAALEVAVRRLAERLAEGADEVRLGHQRDPGDRRDVERLRVGAVHRVARAEQAAVLLLGRSAHAVREAQQPAAAAEALTRRRLGAGAAQAPGRERRSLKRSDPWPTTTSASA